MSAYPPRHRITRVDAPGGARAFWAAKELLDPDIATGPARHARTGTHRYAAHVGRVGALAVSLGIGFAIVNSATGVAFAEGDSDSGSSASSAASDSAESNSTADDGWSKTRGGTRAQGDSGPGGGDAQDSDAGAADGDDSGLDGADTEEEPDDESNEASDHESSADDTITDVDADDGAGADDAEVAVVDAEDTTEVAAGAEVKLKGAPVRPDAAVHSTRTTAGPLPETPAPAEALVSVNPVAAAVSTIVAPLADPELPAPSPLADGVLAWVRRLITHTFFNKTPVVRSIETEQILTGQVLITIDAYDPNGDPLTYDIIQPEGGLVFREPLTGTFVYTPAVPVVGDPVPVEFQVVIRDDSEHLTGVLGSIQKVLHSIARVFRLAQPDNLTQTVGFDVTPILQLPPTAVVLGGLPYVLGDDPVQLLSVAEITDLDSPSLKEVTLTIGAGRQDGDTLGWTAPAGSSIISTWTNAWTLTLSGLASQDDYENALKAVTFSATELGLIGRTVTITLTDEHDVANVVPAFVVATVLPSLPVDLPPSVLATGGAPYFLNGDPVTLLSIAQIIDPDSAALKRALVTISLGRVDGDALGYAPPAGSTVSVLQVDDHTIELSGIHSKADYEAALKAITFSATSLGLVARTIEITLTDADDVDSLAPALVAATVLPAIVLEPPLIVAPVGAPIHTIGKAPVALVSSVAIANADNGQLTGAVVSIGLNRVAGDALGFSAIAGNPVSAVQTNAWTVTLSGTGTVAQYQQMMESITFSATQVGLPRTVTITVTEADGDTSPAPGIVFANSIPALRPTVAVASLPAVYTIGKPGTALAPVVIIEDLDSAVLTGATVSVGVGKQTGDALTYTAPPGITITVTGNGTSTLTFSGTATKEQYEAALEAVTFSATGGALIPRTFAINVTDDSGLAALLPATASAVVKNPDAPTVVTVGLSGLALPTVGATVKPITLATIVDTDSTVLTGASVRITGNRTSGDTLGYSPIAGNPVTATYNSGTGELKLSGTATIAQYKQALEAVTFKATQFGGGFLDVTHIRTLSVYVTDDSNVSNALPGVVAVTVLR